MIGVDLTERFVIASRILSQTIRMNDVTSFEVGSVLDMKGIVQDQSVDAVRLNRRLFEDQIARISKISKLALFRAQKHTCTILGSRGCFSCTLEDEQMGKISP